MSNKVYFVVSFVTRVVKIMPHQCSCTMGDWWASPYGKMVAFFRHSIMSLMLSQFLGQSSLGIAPVASRMREGRWIVGLVSF